MSDSRAQPLDHHIRILRGHGRAGPQGLPSGVERGALLRQSLLFRRQGFEQVILFADLACDHRKAGGGLRFLEPPVGRLIGVPHGGFERLRQCVGGTEREHLRPPER